MNSPLTFPTDSNPYGVYYKNWTGKWWQWIFCLPRSINPLIDRTGRYCAEGQSGPVWFLAGTSGTVRSSKRRCTIPSGKAILFPIVVSQFSFSEVPHINTEEELIDLTARDIDLCSLLQASIDGIQLHDLERYRVRLGPFILHIYANNVWGIKPGVTKAVSDGYWVFLKPLSDGYHSIYFHGLEPHFETEVTYSISVIP